VGFEKLPGAPAQRYRLRQPSIGSPLRARSTQPLGQWRLIMRGAVMRSDGSSGFAVTRRQAGFLSSLAIDNSPAEASARNAACGGHSNRDRYQAVSRLRP